MTTQSLRKFTHSLLLCLALVLAVQPIVGDAQESGGNQIVTQQAFGITDDFGKWPLNFIPWVYNPTGAPADFSEAVMLDIYADAIAEWAGYCNVIFVYGGVDATADPNNINDGVAVFAWGDSTDPDIGPSTAGVAGPAFGGVSPVWGYLNYSDGFFKLNSEIYPSLGTTPGEILSTAISIRETSAHELGHLIGLGHSDLPDTIMYSNPYTSVSHTTEGDISDCRKMYGYSAVYSTRAAYMPPSAGTSEFFSLELTTNLDFVGPADAEDDGARYADGDALFLQYAQLNAYSDDVVVVAVDPYGRETAATSVLVEQDPTSYYAEPIMTFASVRETPGLWTFYAYDSTGLLMTRTLNVTTSVPAVNGPPESTFTFSEDPSTRSISVTTDITSDPEGDTVSLDWHIPSVGQVSNPLQAAPLNDTEVVSLGVAGYAPFDWEVFADVRDSHVRYETATGTGSLGPPGGGWHDLHRYYTSANDSGPDLNGDNTSDIPLRNSSTGQNWLYTMGGNLVVSSDSISTVANPDWNLVGNGDYNKDGKHDKLWWNSSTGQLWMHLMNGATIDTSSAVAKYHTDWRVAGNGDYNGDGNSDILLRNVSTGQIRMLLMDGTTVLSNNFVRNLSTAWSVAGSGDYDGDGNSDILIRHGGTGQNWMFFMNGAAILPASGPVNTVSTATSSIVGNGDYNFDGYDDILWYNSATGKLWVYLMQGRTITIWDVINTINTDWMVAGDGDYNGDSISDVLLYNTSTGQLWIYYMNGTSYFASAPVGTISNLDWGVVYNQ